MAQRGGCDCCSTATTVTSDGEMACYCPVDGIIETISKKYALRIVAALGANGPMRYGDLEDRLEATSSSLFSARLDELAEEGLIERRRFDEMPPRVEYSLTPRGRELETRMQPLLEWAADED